MTRPLHAVFAELVNDETARQAYAADPSGFLDSAGHADLPAELIDEAVVSFTDTASPAIAEHLAPFVMTHGPVASVHGEQTDPPALDGLELLADAPTGQDTGPAESLEPGEPTGQDAGHHETGDTVPADDLDFGTGSDLAPSPATAQAEPSPQWDVAPFDDATAVPDPAPGDEPLLPEPVAEPGDTEPADDLDAE